MSTFAGGNDDRLELLLFYLNGSQPFGINVLKIKEIITCPKLTVVPDSHPSIVGLTRLRAKTLSVIDLAVAIGRPPQPSCDDDPGAVIISEFNRTQQGFLVRKVDRIAVCDWKSVMPPPRGSGQSVYITGVTSIDKHLVQILDVEKVLGEVLDIHLDTSQFGKRNNLNEFANHRVMVVDDSSMARNQTESTLAELGMEIVLAKDGKEALEQLEEMAATESLIDMVISDIEMPEMDGYALTREIRKHPDLSHLYVLLHTSLNGAINEEKAKAAGANAILTKFVPLELADAVAEGLRNHR